MIIMSEQNMNPGGNAEPSGLENPMKVRNLTDVLKYTTQMTDTSASEIGDCSSIDNFMFSEEVI